MDDTKIMLDKVPKVLRQNLPPFLSYRESPGEEQKLPSLSPPPALIGAPVSQSMQRESIETE